MSKLDACHVECDKERNWTFTKCYTSSRTVFGEMKNSFLATSSRHENKKTVSKADIMEEFKETIFATSGPEDIPQLERQVAADVKDVQMKETDLLKPKHVLIKAQKENLKLR